MWQLLNTVWSGIWLGCAYAIVGLGLVLSYRGSRVINLAVGSVFVFCGMQAVWLQNLGVMPVLALLIALVTGVVLFGIQESALMGRLTETSTANQLLSTLAYSICVAGLTAVWFGRDPLTGQGLVSSGQIELGGLRVTSSSLLFVTVSMILALSVWLFVARWRMGRAATAAGYDALGAGLIGLNVPSLRLLLIAGAGVVVAVGAVLFVPLGVLDFSLGLRLTLFGFVAAAVSGYGSVWGTLAGGLAIGVIDALGTAYVSSAFGTAITFAVLIAVALISERVRSRRQVLATV